MKTFFSEKGSVPGNRTAFNDLKMKRQKKIVLDYYQQLQKDNDLEVAQIVFVHLHHHIQEIYITLY